MTVAQDIGGIDATALSRDEAAVRTEGDAGDLALRLEKGGLRLTGGRVPQHDAPVVTGRREPLAVGAPGDAHARLLVSLPLRELPPRRGVPHAHPALPPRARRALKDPATLNVTAYFLCACLVIVIAGGLTHLLIGGVKQMKRGALSYTFSYYYTWDYNWAPYVNGWFMPLIGNVKSHNAIPGITDLFLLAPTTLSREHRRLHVFGATFNKVIGKWAFRGEAAYTDGKAVAVNPLTDTSGQDFESKENTLDYCLGFDRTVYTDWFLSGQIIQNIVLGSNPHMVTGLSLHERKNVDTYFTFVVSKPFKSMNDQAGLWGLIAYNTLGQWWINPKLWWEITQNTKITLGAQIFEGQHYQALGEFKRNTNIYTQVKYSF